MDNHQANNDRTTQRPQDERLVHSARNCFGLPVLVLQHHLFKYEWAAPLKSDRPTRSQESSAHQSVKHHTKIKHADICASVKSVIQQVIGDGSVQDEAVLMDAGVDSLMAVEVRNRLTSQLAVRIPTTVVFDYPTIGAIA
jgi:acyl carrier protein